MLRYFYFDLNKLMLDCRKQMLTYYLYLNNNYNFIRLWNDFELKKNTKLA